MTSDLAAIDQEIRRRAHVIDAPDRSLPTLRVSRGDATPHIERDGDDYLFVIEERGQQYERRRTSETDTLLYWVFEAVTLDMASHWAARHPVAGQEFRRTMWDRQLDLLSRLDPIWASRCGLEIDNRLHKEADPSSARDITEH